ncbi:unnamed protein product [Linum tenue]|uniref:Uncharacterized protein n=1 Tax=Linum tenue TaxID=586396 RepID=A0AAV0KZF7_9ROSI|nr:unnamed protein product [Linum tenue]
MLPICVTGIHAFCG